MSASQSLNIYKTVTGEQITCPVPKYKRDMHMI